MGEREVKALFEEIAREGPYSVGYEWCADRAGAHLVAPELTEFWADHFDISADQYLDWQRFVGPELGKGRWFLPKNYQCSRTTKKGTRCKKKQPVCNDPRAFFRGYSDCCVIHRRELTDREKLLRYEWQSAYVTKEERREAVKIRQRLANEEFREALKMRQPAAKPKTGRFDKDVFRNEEISRQPWEYEENNEDPDEVDKDLFYVESLASYLEEVISEDRFVQLRKDLEEIKAETSSNLGNSHDCQITHSRVDQTWTHDANGKLVRKVYVSKAPSSGTTANTINSRDDGGEGQVELYHSEEDFENHKEPFRICTIATGKRVMIYGPSRSAGKKMFVVVRTTKLGEAEENQFYINVEWWS
jgi:hypothetical protein